MNRFYLFFLLAWLPVSCTQSQHSTIGTPDAIEINSKFKAYWYQGKAEISSYELEQARYGEMHKGTAVLVYVTEDFSRSKQVKLDNPSKFPSDAISSLKLNLLKEFETGIYKYSMMQSVFTPVERELNPNTFKVSASVQDWCGHTFTQINLQTYKYKILTRSYFESDGDQEYQIDKLLLEDEIWNLIRINPELLPDGVVSMLPGALSSRLRHVPLRAEDAKVSVEPVGDETTHKICKIEYATGNRRLEIRFDGNFPYTIMGWTETYKEGDKEMTTRATLKKTILSDYWAKHNNADAALRQELGLEK